MNNRALKPDAQAFDEVKITTVPRYKTSGLSGDEWRISTKIQLLRKGRVIVEQSFGKMEHAIGFLPHMWFTAQDEGKAMFAGEENFCDQEGCSEQATVCYRLKKHWCNESYTHEPIEYKLEDSPIRMFCERHSKRGDCAFEDADSNYEIITGKVVEPQSKDESPSAFGGVVKL